MPNPLINIGNAAGDGTGEVGPRGWLQKINRLPNADSTINAGSGDYTGTTEAKITAAIAAAVTAGAKYVWIPQSMLPYNASLVTFNTSVRMIREGGSPRYFDGAAYGAAGDNSTDDTAAFVAAIAGAQAAAPAVVFAPRPTVAYKITRLSITASNITFLSEKGTIFNRTTDLVANTGMLDAFGATTATATTLSSPAALNALSLSVGSSAGFTIGDTIQLFDQTLLGGQLAGPLEYNIVASTGAGTIGLKWPTRNPYTATGPTNITKMAMLTGIIISGGTWNGPGTAAVGDIIHCEMCIDPTVNNTIVTNHAGQGVIFRRCYKGLMRDNESSTGTTVSSHGFALYGTEGALVEYCIARDGEFNGFDIGNGGMYNTLVKCRTMNSVDVGFVVGHGQNGHHNILIACDSFECGNGGFQCGDPSYAGDQDNIFVACQDFGTTNDGFKLKSGSTRNRFFQCNSINNSSSGFSTDTTSVDNSFIECSGRGNAVHGMSIQARSRIVGGHHDSNTGNGIRVVGTAGSTDDTVIDGAWCKANTLDGIQVNSTNRVKILTPVVENHPAGKNGVVIQTSCLDALVVEPICRNNGGWGVLISDSAGDCARSRVRGGSFNSNTSGTVANNSTASVISPTDAGTFAIDTSQNNNYFFLSCGGSRTVGAPNESVKGNLIVFEVFNNTGGAITTTWNAAYTLAGAWVDPASAKRRMITFGYNGTKWIEFGRTAADL